MSRYVELVECGAKNFYRYGNTLIKFKIDSGLTSIFGKNGSGKSSIVEIIHYVLFGSSYRGINLDKMVNNTNGKALLAYVLLNVTENGHTDTYLIQRGISPNIKRIYKNNSDKEMKVPTKFDNYVVNDILGFNENTHKKIIAVSAGGKPFIKMTLDERRQIIDNITNLNETKTYLKIAKNCMSEISSKLTVIEAEINIQNNALIPYLDILKKNNDDIDTRIDDLLHANVRYQNEITTNEITLDGHTVELDSLNAELIKIVSEEFDLITEYNKNNPREIQEKIIECNSNLKYLKKQVTEKTDEYNKIKPNVVCDHCGNSYTVDQANAKRSEKLIEIDELKIQGRKIKEELDVVTNTANELSEQVNKIREVQNKKSNINYSIQSKKHEIQVINNNIGFIQSTIDKNLVDIDKLTKSKKDSETSLKTQDKIDVLNLKINDLNKERGEILDKIESYKYMIKMLSDEGIKSYILNKFLPILNKLINYYLKIFDMNIYLEIKADYDYVMRSSNGLSDEYDGLSGGQQQRINLAILFAQSDLIKIIGNFKTNVLFLDEFIDGAIDKQGLMDTMNIMKQISIRDNKAIVFISHRLDENLIRNIDHFYMASKLDSDFSEFNCVKAEDVMEIINQN